MEVEIQHKTRSLGIKRNKEDSTKTMQGNRVMTEVKLNTRAGDVGTGATREEL
jgi:hypothetical protein